MCAFYACKSKRSVYPVKMLLKWNEHLVWSDFTIGYHFMLYLISGKKSTHKEFSFQCFILLRFCFKSESQRPTEEKKNRHIVAALFRSLFLFHPSFFCLRVGAFFVIVANEASRFYDATLSQLYAMLYRTQNYFRWIFRMYTYNVHLHIHTTVGKLLGQLAFSRLYYIISNWSVAVWHGYVPTFMTIAKLI